MKFKIEFKPHYTDEIIIIECNKNELEEIISDLLFGPDNVNEVKVKSINKIG
jgi:hypothetical protein